MNNVEAAKTTRKDFLAFCAETKTAEKEKEAINTASLTLDKQLKRFSKTSFSDADIQALYKDSMSV
ncbi:MAG: hypothetical protein LBB72_01565 [Spirochaetaceae bacterium]|jgi:uncharacterized protein YifE (UPF0438 family)|nr:hypothetical protein [Spirochaetaceae bacterium]